jgi:hypothetical protein
MAQLDKFDNLVHPGASLVAVPAVSTRRQPRRPGALSQAPLPDHLQLLYTCACRPAVRLCMCPACRHRCPNDGHCLAVARFLPYNNIREMLPS